MRLAGVSRECKRFKYVFFNIFCYWIMMIICRADDMLWNNSQQFITCLIVIRGPIPFAIANCQSANYKLFKSQFAFYDFPLDKKVYTSVHMSYDGDGRCVYM